MLDNKVIDIVRRVKSLSVMKTSLDKLLDDSKVPEETETKIEKEEVVVKKTEKKVPTKDMKKFGETSKPQNKYIETIINFLEMLKSNPDKVLLVLDWIKLGCFLEMKKFYLNNWLVFYFTYTAITLFWRLNSVYTQKNL